VITATVTVLFGYLPVGFGLPVVIVLPLGIAVTGGIIWFAGKNPVKCEFVN